MATDARPSEAPETEAQPTDSAEVNRRDFVKTAGAVAAAAATLTGTPAVRRAKAAAPSVKYGFIGPGSRGYRLLQRHLQHIDAGECVAICDIYEPNLNQAVELFGGRPTPYTDYTKLLEQPDVEAVFITVPLFAHYPIMADALRAGKHVFCEKSLVFTPEEVHGLRQLHQENPNLVIQVGLQRRYSQFYRAAKKLIDDGAIGKITHIQAQWHRNGSWRRTATPEMEEQINWRLYRRYSGGLCAELMSHQVDVADWFIGSSPKSVMGVGGLDYWKDGRDIYDNIQLIYEYPGGEKLQYSSIMTNRHLEGRRVPGDGCREVILGTDGAIEITLIPYGEGMWFIDPMPEKMGDQAAEAASGEAWKAGATVASDTLEQGEGLPIVPGIRDLSTADMNFFEKELEYAKRWAYRKGIMLPKEEKDPEYAELESFLLDVAQGGRPASDVEVGLQDSIAVMLSILAMDQERKVQFAEIEQMGRPATESPFTPSIDSGSPAADPSAPPATDPGASPATEPGVPPAAEPGATPAEPVPPTAGEASPANA